MALGDSGAPRVKLGGAVDPLNLDHPVGEVNITAFPRSYILAVDDGLVPGARLIRKLGAIQYTTPYDQWKAIATSQTYFTPQVPVSLEILSDDDINDIPGGTGALSVRITGLKLPTSTEEEFEDVALNGTLAQALVNDWWRVYAMEVRISGSYANHLEASHNSVITLRDVATPTDVWAIISTQDNFGLGKTEIGVVSIPAGEVAHLIGYQATVGNTNKAGSIALFEREQAGEQTGPYTGIMKIQEIHRNVPAGGKSDSPYGLPKTHVHGPADIGFMCVGSAAMEAEVNFILLVLKN